MIALMNETKPIQKEESLAKDIEGFLKNIVEAMEIPETTERSQQSAVGRKKILPALVLWSGVVVGILRGFTTQAEIWRRVSWKGLWEYPISKVSDQAVYNRLAEEGNQTLQLLFMSVRDGLKERLAPFSQSQIAPFATGVYAVDGSTLDKMARHLPSLREIPNGDSRLLPGKMVGLFDIRLQQWREMIHLSNPNQNDKVAARELVKELPKGSLGVTTLNRGELTPPFYQL